MRPGHPAVILKAIRHRLPRVALLGVLGCLWMAGAAAQETGLEIRNASTRLENGVWYLAARIDYRLNRETLDALQNGIPLTFGLQVELSRQRNWLPDEDVAELRQDFQLSWDPLARGYLVRNKNSGDQHSHTTLFAALNDLGRITALPLIDAALVEDGEDYEVALRAALDQQQLPGPLRMLAFWNDNFTLESDWYRWDLRSASGP